MHPSIRECNKYGYANISRRSPQYSVFKGGWGSHITNWISLGCRIEKEMLLGSIAECGTKMNPRVQKLWHLISINTSQCESLAAACKRVASLFLFMQVAVALRKLLLPLMLLLSMLLLLLLLLLVASVRQQMRLSAARHSLSYEMVFVIYLSLFVAQMKTDWNVSPARARTSWRALGNVPGRLCLIWAPRHRHHQRQHQFGQLYWHFRLTSNRHQSRRLRSPPLHATLGIRHSAFKIQHSTLIARTMSDKLWAARNRLRNWHISAWQSNLGLK